jgi:hypothetical protein
MLIPFLLLGVAVNEPALADGGTLRISNVPMGAYRISVYTDPTPIPPDYIDISVLATFERGRGVAPDLEIQVVARLLEEESPPFSHPATRAQADDPRFYAAKFSLGRVGRWEILVQVKGPEGEGEARFEVTVTERGPLDDPYVIIGLALLPLVLVGWWLKKSGRNPS